MTAAGAGGDAQDQGETADREDQLEEGEVAGEAVRIKVPKAIAAPTQTEVEEHRLSGHAVYRSWCSSCVRGRGQSNHHHRPGAHDDERGDVPVVSMDYCYLGTKTAEEDAEDEASGTSPVLVIQDSRSKSIMAHLVPRKGVQWDGSEVVVRRDLGEL